jgi:hypothetical protein
MANKRWRLVVAVWRRPPVYAGTPTGAPRPDFPGAITASSVLAQAAMALVEAAPVPAQLGQPQAVGSDPLPTVLAAAPDQPIPDATTKSQRTQRETPSP